MKFLALSALTALTLAGATVPSTLAFNERLEEGTAGTQRNLNRLVGQSNSGEEPTVNPGDCIQGIQSDSSRDRTEGASRDTLNALNDRFDEARRQNLDIALNDRFDEARRHNLNT
jgi:hypothetical protein